MGGDTVVSGTSDVIETGGGVVGTGGDNTGVVEGSGTAVGNSVINDSAQISPGTVPVLQSPGNIVLNPNIRSSDLWNMLAGRGQYPPSHHPLIGGIVIIVYLLYQSHSRSAIGSVTGRISAASGFTGHR
jgi:hypothetical protein